MVAALKAADFDFRFFIYACYYRARIYSRAPLAIFALLLFDFSAMTLRFHFHHAIERQIPRRHFSHIRSPYVSRRLTMAARKAKLPLDYVTPFCNGHYASTALSTA